MLWLACLAGELSAGNPENVLSFIIGTVQSEEKPETAETRDTVQISGVATALDEVIVSKPSVALRPLNYIASAFATDGFYDTGYLSTGADIRLGTGGSPSYQGVFYMRHNETITSGFGYRKKFHRVHLGIDIAMEEGDTVRAPVPGVVFKVSYDPHGYGNCVILKHRNGMETRYAHLSSPLVAEGQRIAAGDAVALSGNSGNSTGPHLHFETRVLGIPVDPRSLFDFARY